MQRSTNYPSRRQMNPEQCRRPLTASRTMTMTLWILLLAGVAMLSACGGGSSAGSQNSASLSGNWQFTVSPPNDGSFLGGLQGGFLLQQNGTVTGSAGYSIFLPPAQLGGNPTMCNSGSAPITGTISGQTVTLTATAGTQTFTFTGALSADGSTMTGTYASTAGTAPDGSACGTAQTGLQWTASSVPPITGPIQGSFHSTGTFNNQDFLVSGLLAQGQNIGASNATVTGTLTFVNPTTLISNYPCFSTASVNGQISGNTVILQIIGTDAANSGSNIGQIGGVSNSGVNAVTVASTQGGYVLQDAVTPGYAVISKACPGGGVLTSPGDSGNICLSLNGTNACQQPITLSPAFLTFPSQTLGSAASTQTITVENNSASTLSNLTLAWSLSSNNGFSYNSPGSYSDFNGLPNFQEQDSCIPTGETLPPDTTGPSFSLSPGQSCVVTIAFTPQGSCPWIPFGTPPSIAGAPPDYCPLSLAAELTVNNVPSPDNDDTDTSFAVSITGAGLSAVQSSVPELDFGAEEALNPPEASLPQSLTFINQSTNPVQILGNAPSPCTNPLKGPLTLMRPLNASAGVAGLQVVGSQPSVNNDITADGATIQYNCDSDSQSGLPNFQISADTCTGTTLMPQASCSLQITYVPQPATLQSSGLDYFLELNTLQCGGGVTSDCEIDSGRFPVELTANPTSPLRMSPAAGLDFGTVSVGKSSVTQEITILNDPNLASPQTITFVGKAVVSGSYSETDNCPFSLAPGASCVMVVTFKPKATGFNSGKITINYTPEPTGEPQTIHLRGAGQ